MTKQLRVGINGCGRLGRAFIRQYLGLSDPQFKVVVINELMSLDQLTYLLEFDSVHGRLPLYIAMSKSTGGIQTQQGHIIYSQSREIPDWRQYNLDLVVELSGCYTSEPALQQHLTNGAPRVLLGAPLLDASGLICRQFSPRCAGLWPGASLDLTAQTEIYTAFSCTTQALATLLRPLLDAGNTEKSKEKIEILSAMVTELHGFTSSQLLVDGPHGDWRRGRGATTSIIPTATQGIYGLESLFPSLQNKIAGYSIRVPVPNVAALDVCVQLRDKMNLNQIIQLYTEAAQGQLLHVLGVDDQPTVSVDYIGRTESAVLAIDLCQISGHQLRLYAWYDNEYGYASRLIDTLSKTSDSLNTLTP